MSMTKGAALSALIVMAAGSAQADPAPVTLAVGGEFTHPYSLGLPPRHADWDYRLSGLQGTVSLKPSNDWVGIFAFMDAFGTPVDGANVTRHESPSSSAVTVATPLQSMSGAFDDLYRQFTVSNVTGSGGVLFSITAGNPASTGGFLKLTDFRIDLALQSVYAHLEGGNGVGSRVDQLVWNFDVGVGGTYLRRSPVTSFIHGLAITEESRGLFAQAMGLTALGAAGLSSITDFGEIDFAFTAEMHIAHHDEPTNWRALATPAFAVPEPSTTVVMGVGLIGLAYVRRKALRPSSQH